MKYFPPDEFEDQSGISPSAAKAQERKLSRAIAAYRTQLVKLKSRISKQAWNFFAFGFRGWGLHDAQLLSFAAGDGLGHHVYAGSTFDGNKQKMTVQIRFLNFKQTLLYSFDCSDVRRVDFKYPVQDPQWNLRRIDDLLTYELTAVNEHYLSLEFLFASDATVLVEFGRLKFKRQRVSHRRTKL